jgi:hypothetical protein
VYIINILGCVNKNIIFVLGKKKEKEDLPGSRELQRPVGEKA